MKTLETDVDVKRFFLANQVQNAYKKISDAAKPVVLSLLAAKETIYYTLDEDDASVAPEVIHAGTPLKAITSSKSTRLFLRPCEVKGLSSKQVAALTVFDGKLIDAAVTAGVITAAQAAEISLPSKFAYFPLVQAVK